MLWLARLINKAWCFCAARNHDKRLAWSSLWSRMLQFRLKLPKLLCNDRFWLAFSQCSYSLANASFLLQNRRFCRQDSWQARAEVLPGPAGQLLLLSTWPAGTGEEAISTTSCPKRSSSREEGQAGRLGLLLPALPDGLQLGAADGAAPRGKEPSEVSQQCFGSESGRWIWRGSGSGRTLGNPVARTKGSGSETPLTCVENFDVKVKFSFRSDQ